jgi:hypothetical protein
MPYKDFLPRNWEEFNVWMQNWNRQLPSVAAKYNIPADVLAQTAADAAWVKYWAQVKYSVKTQQKQLNDFLDAVVKGEINSAAPSEPTFTMPPAKPAPVPNGIRQRIRKIARQIKGSRNYSEADGELLDILIKEMERTSLSELAPAFKIRTRDGYELEISFRKQGMDALRLEIRHKGGAWTLAMILTSSPGAFTVTPTTGGDAEQIEIRAVFLKKNNPTGNYSGIKTAVIAP